jgi:hypothetical protein
MKSFVNGWLAGFLYGLTIIALIHGIALMNYYLRNVPK